MRSGSSGGQYGLPLDRARRTRCEPPNAPPELGAGVVMTSIPALRRAVFVPTLRSCGHHAGSRATTLLPVSLLPLGLELVTRQYDPQLGEAWRQPWRRRGHVQLFRDELALSVAGSDAPVRARSTTWVNIVTRSRSHGQHCVRGACSYGFDGVDGEHLHWRRPPPKRFRAMISTDWGVVRSPCRSSPCHCRWAARPRPPPCSDPSPSPPPSRWGTPRPGTSGGSGRSSP